MTKTFGQNFEDWNKDFEKFVIQDIQKVLDLDQMLKPLNRDQDNIAVGLILLTYIAIESVSGYFMGRVAKKGDRGKFIKQYFPIKYKNHFSAIQKLRNSLTHDYGLEPSPRIVMFHFSHESHLQTCDNNGVRYLSFNRSRFAGDFLDAWGDYLKDLKVNQTLQNNWEKRVNDPRGYVKLIPSPCNAWK